MCTTNSFQDLYSSDKILFYYLDLDLNTPRCWFPVRDTSVPVSVDLLKSCRQWRPSALFMFQTLGTTCNMRWMNLTQVKTILNWVINDWVLMSAYLQPYVMSSGPWHMQAKKQYVRNTLDTHLKDGFASVLGNQFSPVPHHQVKFSLFHFIKISQQTLWTCNF